MASVPSHIGRYQIQGAIGEGGMGALFKAWDPKLEREVAIKVLRGDDSEMRERFAREARSAAHLRHPNIVTIFDVGEEAGQPFIAMELIQGQTLAELIRTRAPIALGRKLELIEALCEGLGFAHRAGVVHRDVKPANMMVDADGALKILDFGIARFGGGGGVTHAGMLIGTLNYMSPEQVMGKDVDARCDIYAVGLVFYELLAGRQAFPGDLDTGILNRILSVPPDPIAATPGVPPEVARIVDRAIAKDPNQRYQDLAAMRVELEQSRTAVAGAPIRPTAGVVAPAMDAAASDAASTILLRPATGAESGGAPQKTSTAVRTVGFAALGVGVAVAGYFALGRRTPAAPAPQSSAASPVADARIPARESQPAVTPPASGAEHAGRAAAESAPAQTTDPGVADAAAAVRAAREFYDHQDRARALTSIQRALQLRPSDPDTRHTLDEWLTAADAEAHQAQVAAEIAGRSAANSKTYADAVARSTQGRSEQRDRPDQALLDLWAATAIFKQAAVEPSSDARTALSPPPAPAPARDAGLPAAPPGRASSPAPTPAPPPPVDPAVRRRTEQPAVDSVIEQYRAAVDARNLADLTKVFPTAPPSYKELFDDMKKVSLELSEPKTDYDAAWTTATVRAKAKLAVSPKNGFSQSTTVVRTFILRKADGRWTITSVTDNGR